jgi:hypothetical protein
MRSIICLAAKGVVRDADTGNISVYSILEQFNAEGFPFFVQELALLATWKRKQNDPPDVDLRVKVRNNDRVLSNEPIRVTFGDKLLNRSIVNLRGLVVHEVGALHFEFVHDDKVIANYSIDIQAPAPRALPAQG